MYRINLDMVNKVIYIEASGFISQGDINYILVTLCNIMDRFDKGQYSVLFLEHRLDPLPQDNLQLAKKALELVLCWAKKVAAVSGNRTITMMQAKRIEAEARKEIDSNIPIMRFQTIIEAMNYINQ